MTESTSRREPTGLARGFAGVTVATVLGNLFAYVLLLTAARRLGSNDYAVLVSLINVLLVGSVPSFALQAVVARRVATGDTHDLVRVSSGVALAVGLLFALLAPVESAFLHLNGLGQPLLVALAIPGIAIQGLCQGIWQGRQGFGPLALVTFVGLIGRSGVALAGLLVWGTATGALCALTVGVSVGAALCFARLPVVAAEARPGSRHELMLETRSLISEAARAAHAYAVLLLLSVADVLLASHLLDRRTAAVYAAGSVMTKAALWLPQSVASVLFASMPDHGRHRDLFLRAAAGLVALGAAISLVCLLAGGLVSAVVGGNRYPQLHNEIWLFAALGSCLAVTQFAVVSGLAIRDSRAAWVAWLTIAAEIAGVYLLRQSADVRTIVTTVTVVNLVAAAAAVSLRAARRDPAPESR